MIEVGFVIAGGLWRWWDGTGKWARTSVRNAVGLVVGAAAGHYAMGEWGALVGALAVVNLIPGYTKWEDPGYMAVRYGLPACLVTVAAALVYSGGLPLWVVLYPFACALAGVSYWAFAKVDQWLPRISALGITGSTTYSEMLAGAVLVGSVGCF